MHGGGGTVAVSAAVVSDGELVLMVTTASHNRIRIQFTVGGWEAVGLRKDTLQPASGSRDL
jgi:hypothetical protein